MGDKWRLSTYMPLGMEGDLNRHYYFMTAFTHDTEADCRKSLDQIIESMLQIPNKYFVKKLNYTDGKRLCVSYVPNGSITEHSYTHIEWHINCIHEIEDGSSGSYFEYKYRAFKIIGIGDHLRISSVNDPYDTVIITKNTLKEALDFIDWYMIAWYASGSYFE